MNFFEKIKKMAIKNWILIAIILIGIFLRTYNFHEWLKFRDDQSRDASLVSQVVDGKAPWPVMGAYMSYSGAGDHLETGSFHLGPIYYYFQIISGKVFGNYADKLAYPDVFFGIMSIFLLFLFLRIYFEKNIALGITGLYALSSYFVQYSRFAWNTNLIPFFVLLLLISLHKFLEKNEKTSLPWAVSLGVALGVGLQLHAILIVLFSVVTFLIFLFTVKKNPAVLKKWGIVLVVICILNATQIYSEVKTGFSNTKILFNFSSQNENPENTEKIGKLTLIKNDLNCNIEANSYFLSSYGSSNCTYDLLSPALYDKIRIKKFSRAFEDISLRSVMLASIILSIAGYFLLFKNIKKENEKSKKYFLILVSLYVGVSFVAMVPLSYDKFNDLRYFTPTFFVPYVLIGLIIKFLIEKLPKIHGVLIVLMYMILISANILAIMEIASPLLRKERTCTSRSTTIGELEPVAQYIISNSDGNKPVYVGGDKTFRVVYGPLSYILKKNGIDSQEIDADPSLVGNNGPAYMVSCKSGLAKKYEYKQIGAIYVFQLNK